MVKITMKIPSFLFGEKKLKIYNKYIKVHPNSIVQ